jgi:hypothetical protein
MKFASLIAFASLNYAVHGNKSCLGHDGYRWTVVTLNAHDYKDPNMDQMAVALMSSLHPITKLRLILGDVTLPMRRAIETAGLQRRFPL